MLWLRLGWRWGVCSGWWGRWCRVRVGGGGLGAGWGGAGGGGGAAVGEVLQVVVRYVCGGVFCFRRGTRANFVGGGGSAGGGGGRVCGGDFVVVGGAASDLRADVVWGWSRRFSLRSRRVAGSLGGGAAGGFAAALLCLPVRGADDGGVDLDVDEGGVRGTSQVTRGFCRRPKTVPTYNEVR